MIFCELVNCFLNNLLLLLVYSAAYVVTHNRSSSTVRGILYRDEIVGVFGSLDSLRTCCDD